MQPLKANRHFFALLLLHYQNQEMHKSILIAAGLFIASCGNEEKVQQGKKPVPAVTVEQRTIEGYREVPTSIQGRNNNDVRAKISGYIQEVYVDEGQYVGQGQPLFRLETNTLSQSANAAQSGVSAAQASIAAAQATVDAAQVEVDKLVPLVNKNIISSVQLETAKANLLRAKSQLSQARAGYHQAQANYKSAAASVDYSVIRAPISGVVGKINLRKGSLVGPSDPTPITTVSDTKELYAYFSMNEKDYLDFLNELPGASIREKINNLPMVNLVLANGRMYSEKGKVQTVTGQIDPQTGSVQFRVSFPNKQGLLTNGNSGKIRIPKQYNNALIVPEPSTYEQQGIVYVYKIVNDTTVSAKITVQDRVDNLVVLESGVKAGDIIVAKGVGNLKGGTAVKPQLTTIDSIVQPLNPIF